jgi:hypothetical protein
MFEVGGVVEGSAHRSWFSRTTGRSAISLFLRAGPVILAMALVLYAGRLGLQRMDMGLVADGGWRIWLGQVPYRDFKLPWFPLTLYLQALFFWVFGGFHWLSLLWHAAILNGVGALLTYSIAKKRLGRLAAASCAALSALTLYGPLAFPWYDTTAFLLVLLALWLVEEGSGVGVGNHRLHFFLAGGSLAFATLSKFNIGAAGLAAVLVIAVADETWRSQRLAAGARAFRTAANLVGGFVAVGGLATVWLQSQGPFLESVASLSQHATRLGRVLDPGWWKGMYGSLGDSPHAISTLLLGTVGVTVVCSRRWLAEHTGPVGPLLTRLSALAGLHLFAAVTGQLHPSIYQPLLGLLVAYTLSLCAVLRSEDALGEPVLARLVRWGSMHGRGLGVGLIVLAALGLLRRSGAGHRDFLERYSANYLAILALLAAMGVVGLLCALHAAEVASKFERVHRARGRLLARLVFAALFLFFLVEDVRRRAWEYYFPTDVYRASFVPARLEGFEGIQMDRPMAASLAGLVGYTSDHVAAGEQVFVWPNYRWVLPALGREPIRGTLLLHQPPITHRPGSDSETAAVIAANPHWIILNGENWALTLVTMRSDSPNLEKWVTEHFELAEVIPGFTVLRRSDRVG